MEPLTCLQPFRSALCSAACRSAEVSRDICHMTAQSRHAVFSRDQFISNGLFWARRMMISILLDAFCTFKIFLICFAHPCINIKHLVSAALKTLYNKLTGNSWDEECNEKKKLLSPTVKKMTSPFWKLHADNFNQSSSVWTWHLFLLYSPCAASLSISSLSLTFALLAHSAGHALPLSNASMWNIKTAG